MANITIPPGLQTAGSGLATETTLTATNTKLDTLITQTDGLEVSVGNVDVNTDQLETLVGVTNTKLDSVILYVDGIEGSLTSLVAKDFATETTLAAAKLVLDSIDNGLPNALGRQAAVASTGVVLSTEDKTSLDAVGTKLDSLITKTSGALIPVAYDTIVPNLAGATTDIYVYKTGGVGGATVATLTINYVASDKLVISSVVRT